jgi:hypothetical protein
MDRRENILSNRRGFFKQVFCDAVCLFEECMGRPQLSLKELQDVPDEIMRDIIPVFNAGRHTRIEGNILYLEDVKSGNPYRLCELDEKRICIWDFIDGLTNIENIARNVEARFGIEFDQAYEETRSFFILLAENMICHPAGAHERADDQGEG